MLLLRESLEITSKSVKQPVTGGLQRVWPVARMARLRDRWAIPQRRLRTETALGTPLLSPRENFIRLVSRPEGEINLAYAALQIAGEEYPGLDTVAYLGRIALLGERVKRRLPARHSVYDAIHAINHVLFEEEGFQGNNKDYYDPRNSYLNEVLDRGAGIPITLSVLYMEVARRAGHRLRGAGMPGHFLVAAGRGKSRIFIDAFHRGGLLSRKECIALAERSGALKVQRPKDRPPGRLTGKELDAVERHVLPAVDTKTVLRRILINLKVLYARQRDYERALKASERIQVLSPDNWRNLSDLARFQAQVGQFSEAVTSLRAFLQRAPSGADTRQAKDALRQLLTLSGRQERPQTG